MSEPDLMTQASPRRQLGSLSIWALGLGCIGVSWFYGRADQRASSPPSIGV
jgi:hypothetical protein